uniref:Uncharacterized protein n=1 Tax=Panagrolaimus sp. JU765 TaxID=591449 RepID=A0AC34PZZ0_9BILA
MTAPSTKLGEAYLLAAATIKKLKCELKPGELENTVNFVEQFLEYGIENDKTLQSSTILLLKLGLTTDWMMDLPLWCLVNKFESPRDAIFEKDVSELYMEIHKIMKTNKVRIISQ